jgi:methyl-accepting chemotaxis protein
MFRSSAAGAQVHRSNRDDQLEPHVTTFWASLTIRSKIAGSFGLVLITILGVSLTAVNRLSAINDLAADMRDNWLPSTGVLGQLLGSVQELRVKEARVVIADSDRARQLMMEEVTRRFQAVEKLRSAYEPLITRGTDDERLMRVFDAAWTEHKQTKSKYLDDGKANAREFFDDENSKSFLAAAGAVADDLKFNVDEGERLATEGGAIYSTTRTWMVGVIVAAVGMCLLLGYAIIRNVSAPIRLLTGAMTRLAGSDWSTEVPLIARRDELGEMAKTVAVFKTNGIAATRLAAEVAEQGAARDRRAERLNALTLAFETKSGELVGRVSSAATELQATAESMTGTAGQTTQQATGVAAAAEEASANVQTVAAAAEQLASSIGEISRQVAQSAKVAGKALDDARHTDAVVQALADSAQKIGEVVGLISNIAGQTNLLALNATIEAARAGDAGKGFAVVASEVKNLATQTGKATDDISRQISQIQSATKEAVESIRGIGTTISEISEIAATIAAAVEEQGAATQEIARNVQQAACGTQEVSSNIVGVSQGANDTGTAASRVLGAAGDLSRQAEQLRSEVGGYISGVKAA